MFVTTDGEAGGGGPGVGTSPMASAIDEVEVPLAAVIGLINASTGRLVQLVAQALETGVWAQAGIRSPEHWLAWRGGVSLGRARRLVTLARRSSDLPVTTAALVAGELSEDQAVEVALHVPAAHDAEVAALARHATVSQVRTVARRYTFQPAPTEQDEPAPPEKPEDLLDRNRVTFGVRGRRALVVPRRPRPRARCTRPAGTRGVPGRRARRPPAGCGCRRSGHPGDLG